MSDIDCARVKRKEQTFEKLAINILRKF